MITTFKLFEKLNTMLNCFVYHRTGGQDESLNYGKYAPVHRTNSEHSIKEFLFKEGFKGAPYAFYDMNTQIQDTLMEQAYGKFVIKIKVNLENTIILSYPVAKIHFGDNWRLIDQFKMWFKISKETEKSILDFESKYSKELNTNIGVYYVDIFKIQGADVLPIYGIMGFDEGALTYVPQNPKSIMPVAYCETKNGKIINGWHSIHNPDLLNIYKHMDVYKKFKGVSDSTKLSDKDKLNIIKKYGKFTKDSIEHDFHSKNYARLQNIQNEKLLKDYDDKIYMKYYLFDDSYLRSGIRTEYDTFIPIEKDKYKNFWEKFKIEDNLDLFTIKGTYINIDYAKLMHKLYYS